MIPTSSTVLADTCVSESTEKIAELSGAKREKTPLFIFAVTAILTFPFMFEYLFLFCFFGINPRVWGWGLFKNGRGSGGGDK